MANISVIITTYKREVPLIREAVDSVKNQTFKPTEIIIIDDNGIGTEYQRQNEQAFSADPMVSYLANEKNSGAQYSRNRGILTSHGDFIAFLDDDDFWESTKLEKQMQEVIDDRVGLVFCQGYTFVHGEMNNKKVYASSARFIKYPSFQDLLEKDYIGSTTQALIRRSALDEVGMFDPDMPARQDYEMWIRISKKFKVVGVQEKLFYHRIHKSEQISKNPDKAICGYQLLLKKYREDYQKNPHALSYKYYLISKMYLAKKAYGKSIKYIVRAFFKSPGYMLKSALKN